jgi:hypothetical protein
VNVGVVEGLTCTVIVVVPAHWLLIGVKVYVVVVLLLIAGVQVPGIAFVDVVGNVNVPPAQIGAT